MKRKEGRRKEKEKRTYNLQDPRNHLLRRNPSIHLKQVPNSRGDLCDGWVVPPYRLVLGADGEIGTGSGGSLYLVVLWGRHFSHFLPILDEKTPSLCVLCFVFCVCVCVSVAVLGED